MLFRDRREAGRLLGSQLMQFANQENVIVLALPRGGVPVGFEVARTLHAPLDVCIVRKLGVPGHEELAMGAIASGGVRVMNADVVDAYRLSPDQIEAVATNEARELSRRERQYRRDSQPLSVRGRTVILVDDGLATGSTMRAAVRALRQAGPQRLIVAVPVAARSTCEELAQEADGVVCLRTPQRFHGVGQWYAEFPQTTDEEVTELLDLAADRWPSVIRRG